MKNILKKLNIPLSITLFVFFYNEYLIYWHVLSKCSWAMSNSNVSSLNTTNIMLLADTHLLGSRKGHWFDKLRREWQQYRAYKTASILLKPDYIIILGDLTDEGKWCTDAEWNYYVRRTQDIFQLQYEHTKLLILVGNHDIGFHYNLHERLIERFNRSFTKQFIHLHETVNNDYFILANSMTLENDKCEFCTKAQKELKKLNYKLNCIKYKNCSDHYSKLKYTRPILFTHFPLYRDSDDICPVDIDSEPVEHRAKFRQKYDCLSKDATKQVRYFNASESEKRNKLGSRF